jgi:hypothetical protein
MAQNQKGKQSLKAQRRYNAHIDRGNGLSVIAKKCLRAFLEDAIDVPGRLWSVLRTDFERSVRA